MPHDDLDAAYATLGLNRNVPLSAVKRQYKVLVRRWHPDRFVNDVHGIAEATDRLKALNGAYRIILEHRSVAAPPCPANVDVDPDGYPIRLTREQIDDIVATIRHAESLDGVLFDETSGWWSRTASIVLVTLYTAIAWGSGVSVVRVLAWSILPVACIWFPDAMGNAVGGRITKTSPPAFVWFFGWVVILIPVLGLGIVWLMMR